MMLLHAVLIVLCVEGQDDLCSDFNQGVECGRSCQEAELECRNACSDDDDRSCEYHCLKSLSACIEACPCFDECLNGCDGCESDYCQCVDPESNADYIFCQRAAEAQYNRCVYTCDIGDAVCFSECNRDYTANHALCPCMDGCPNGCPCENQSLEYQCPSPGPVFTTTALLHRTVTALLAYTNGDTEDMSVTYGDDVDPIGDD